MLDIIGLVTALMLGVGICCAFLFTGLDLENLLEQDE
jgi:hypothetical protein